MLPGIARVIAEPLLRFGAIHVRPNVGEEGSDATVE